MILEAKFTEAEQELNANFGAYAMVGGNTDLNYNPNSKNAQSGIAVEEAFESKKADTLFVDDEDKLEGKYPSALASKKYADNFGSALTQKTQELEQIIQSVSNGKEDKSNRIDDLKVPQSDLVGKYPSALAVDDLMRNYSDGVQYELGLKADKEDVNNTFANAVKGTIEGVNVVTAKNVSPVEHKVKVKANTDTEIRVCGKNLLSVNEVTFLQHKEVIIEPIPAGKYVFSFRVEDTNGADGNVYVGMTDSSGELLWARDYFSKNTRNIETITLTKPATSLLLYSGKNGSASTGITATYSEMQVEEVGTVSDFEPYNKTTYILKANADSEIQSLSPIMNIISNNSEAVISCEYNRDTNAIVENSMELIGEYTYTGEETSKAVYFSKDKNGNPLKLDEVAIYIDLGSSVAVQSSQSYSCYVNEENISECVFYKSGNGSSVRYYQAYAKRCGKGYWLNIGYVNMASATYNGQAYYNYGMGGVDYIYKLKVSMPLIQAGAKLRVYGRRVS